MDEVKYIISAPHPDAGLSNRIKCLISVIRLADKLSRKLLVYWPVNFSCGARFSELFKNHFDFIDKSTLNHILSSEDTIKYSEFPKKLDDKKYIVFDTWRFILLPEDRKKIINQFDKNVCDLAIDLQFEKVPKNLRKIFLSYLSKLNPQDEVLNKINLFSVKKNISEMVGVHVRRNEFILNGRAQNSNDLFFFKRMDDLLLSNPNLRFFLATDSKKTEEIFKERYGNKIVTFPKENLDRNSSVAIQEALIELLLLSKTKRLLGTYASTFTEMAWWFGKCKSTVEIVGLYSINFTDRKSKSTLKSLIFRGISSSVQFLRRNSPTFRYFLRLFGMWG